MKCPVCGCTDDKVLDTRPIDDDRSIRRRRECLRCQHRFTSYESIEKEPLVICKRDNTRESFSREKIMNGLKKACQKRPVSVRQMTAIVDEIESELNSTMSGEVPTREIGERIMVKLRELDEVAYIRFASVYRDFDDADSFLEELENLKRLKAEKSPANNSQSGK